MLATIPPKKTITLLTELVAMRFVKAAFMGSVGYQLGLEKVF